MDTDQTSLLHLLDGVSLEVNILNVTMSIIVLDVVMRQATSNNSLLAHPKRLTRHPASTYIALTLQMIPGF